ncbi:Replication factor A, C-terminal [Plasmopara halstedii]|uniref:Replication factor A, C-terminal n=1 Tax=Plasmopara halstedii TaxID=4781 RepID=A0A0P1AYJ4_PLAHL|nr:Replication factor A, C-terminal [Plasmopara halstedii]CEG46224.1 Replication factor A, C-terminal [Plasmopara halstedii]|eukprot:XP_024582593.1 Replication factor A, C-terminal [Plasmopara halstedii]
MATEFVPGGVITKASLDDMIYTACPRCYISMKDQFVSNTGMELPVHCASCGLTCSQNQLQFKYRLQLRLVSGSKVVDAMLFDEVAEALLGVSALNMKSNLLFKYPTLPQVLKELLVGLHVSFSFQRPAPKKSKHFQRDLKITKIEPLIPQLLPEPAAKLAINLIDQMQQR